MNVVFFGARFEQETNGAFGCLVNEDPMGRVEWNDVFEALAAGQSVTITPADQGMLAFAEADMAKFKADETRRIFMEDPDQMELAQTDGHSQQLQQG